MQATSARGVRGLMPDTPPGLTEHQSTWWGTQKCRRCNPGGLPERPAHLAVLCPDCDGSGYTKWAALATEPWSEIIPRLWIGGHDYNVGYDGFQDIRPAYPGAAFDVVVSMYHRPGHEPAPQVDHFEYLFPDSELNPSVLQTAVEAACTVASRHRKGDSVLVRCQAGLNRSSLVAGLAMIDLGYSGEDAVQLIRARRSPSLCNDDYAELLLHGSD